MDKTQFNPLRHILDLDGITPTREEMLAYYTNKMMYFNNLRCSRLNSIIKPEDEYKLYKIAKSDDLATLKKKEINKIMLSYPYFKAAGAGTNRIAYFNTNDRNQVIKVAMDAVALQDGIREFQNQKFLKPYCTKIFEYSHNGVLTSSERVIPINVYEIFEKSGDRIFATLVEKLISNGYIFDDLGASFYKNWGIRNTGDPVILDFPYVWKIPDINVLICKSKINDEGDYCKGSLDYDKGLNKLFCERCGRKYFAKEIIDDELDMDNIPSFALEQSLEPDTYNSIKHNLINTCNTDIRMKLDDSDKVFNSKFSTKVSTFIQLGMNKLDKEEENTPFFKMGIKEILEAERRKSNDLFN